MGQIYEWGLVQEGGALYLNSYEPMQAALPDGMKLTVTGGYPYDGTVHIAADSAGKERVLALRIPAWSRHTSVTVNGQTATPAAGGYYILSGVFEPDKEILFKLDFTPRIERGALDCEGKSCVYVGPVLYGFNASLHPELDIANLPNLKAGDIAKARPALFPDGSARLALPGGILLSDFYHLGLTGCEYRTWLPIV